MIELVALDMAGTTIDEHGDVYRALEQSVRETAVTNAVARKTNITCQRIITR